MVDEQALCTALKENRLLGAGLDVYEDEPLKDSLLTTFDNVVLTSHIGAHTCLLYTSIVNRPVII